jgi:hypothetical protein
MDPRNILIAGFDILLAFLVVFVLAFLAVRYDEQRGIPPAILAVNSLEASKAGHYEGMHYVGLYLSKEETWLHEFRFGSWLEPGPKLTSDWRAVIDAELRRLELPVVIYELESSQRFGDAVKLVLSTGQPVGIASIQASAREADEQE